MHQVCTLNSISFQPFTIYHAIYLFTLSISDYFCHILSEILIQRCMYKINVFDQCFIFFRSECLKSRRIFQHSKIFNKKKFGIPLLIFFSNYSSIKYKLVQSCVFDRYMYTCINYSCILLHVRIWNVRRHF